jgi:hypothetical protein
LEINGDLMKKKMAGKVKAKKNITSFMKRNHFCIGRLVSDVRELH